MKKTFKNIALSLGAAALIVPTFVLNVQAASGVVLSYDNDNVNVEINVPEKYEIVADNTTVYCGNPEDYGVSESDLTGSVDGKVMIFDALYVDESSYFVETYLSRQETADDERIGNLSDYVDEALEDFNDPKAMEEGFKEAGLEGTAEYTGIHKTSTGEVYIAYNLTFTMQGQETKASLLCTFVSGKAYYFYSRTTSPSTDFDVLSKNVEELVEGVTYPGKVDAPTKKTKLPGSGINLGRVLAGGIVGGVSAAIIAVVVGVVSSKKRKKNA